MNAQRRKAIRAITTKLDQLLPQITALEEEVKALVDQIETIQQEEQDAYDALPEALQTGERGEKMDAALQALESAREDLNSFAELLGDDLPLGDIQLKLEEAAE